MTAEDRGRVRVEVSTAFSTGGRREVVELVVSSNLAEAVQEIRAHLQTVHSGEPFMVLLNGIAVRAILARQGTHRVKEGDLFAVMPVVSGG